MTNPDMYQCPYEPACQCSMLEPCNGCEEWAAFHASANKPGHDTRVIFIGAGMGCHHIDFTGLNDIALSDDAHLLHTIELKRMIDDFDINPVMPNKEPSWQAMSKGLISKKDRRK